MSKRNNIFSDDYEHSRHTRLFPSIRLCCRRLLLVINMQIYDLTLVIHKRFHQILFILGRKK